MALAESSEVQLLGKVVKQKSFQDLCVPYQWNQAYHCLDIFPLNLPHYFL